MPTNTPLHNKFDVYQDGNLVKEFTFTLKPESDEFARAAILAYADACEDKLPILANDIRAAYGE
jgi:hypothetical protein